ncbi:hypothetical protein ACPPVS_00390 [Cellulomonas sp. McL0617]|uniref:hypothetical protein n=1 Tax=Cellulomonas sp. McL0617 TaxID=3415675 RepID=UPI003CF759C4
MTTPPEVPSPERAPRRGLIVTLAVLLAIAIVVIVVLVVRGDGSTDEPVASPSPTPSASPAPEPTTTTQSSSPSAVAGCAPNGVAVPTGAHEVEVVDIDGDGRSDTAWISPGADRRFGITTASGATFSIAIVSASPVPASAVVNLVQTDKLPIALVDLGREAFVYSLAQCQVQTVANAQGQPYTFDRGFAGVGTGVGCSGTDLDLAGLNAVTAADGTYTVTRTFVTLDADARHATNGSPAQVATGAASTDPVVTTAQKVTCGDLVAGDPADGPVEPQ